MQPDKFIRIKQVTEIIGIAPSTIYQWLREGSHGFPKPIKIGGKTTLYRLSEVTEWVNRHIQ